MHAVVSLGQALVASARDEGARGGWRLASDATLWFRGVAILRAWLMSSAWDSPVSWRQEKGPSLAGMGRAQAHGMQCHGQGIQHGKSLLGFCPQDRLWCTVRQNPTSHLRRMEDTGWHGCRRRHCHCTVALHAALPLHAACGPARQL
jgi:hypothetical protein